MLCGRYRGYAIVVIVMGHSLYRACSPIISSISSSHPISFLAPPPLTGSLLPACFK